MDLLSFIRIADPTKVRIGERQHDEDEHKLLETTIGSVVSLIPVSPDRSSGELKASVEKLFGDGGSGEQAEQGDSTSGGHGVGIDVVAKTSVEDVAPVQLKCQKTQKTKAADAGEPSHPAKKAVKNAKDSHANNYYCYYHYSHRYTAAVAKEKLAGSSVFGVDSLFASGSHPTPGGFFDCFGSDFLIGGIQTMIDLGSNLQKVYVPQWNVTNGFCLGDSGVCREMVDEIVPSKYFASVRGMDHGQLFTEFNVEVSRQMSLSAEVRMRAEYNIKERRRLNSVVEEKDSLLKSREQEVAYLDVVVTSVKLQNDSLADQDEKIEEVNEKFDKLYADFVEMDLHVEEKFYPCLLTTISGCRWLLTHGIKFAITKCLNSTEYLCALGTSIGKAIEKGMQEGLSAGITHGAEGRKLTDVATYNPSADADYLSALQCLQSVNFSLIAKLKMNKDASVETIMSLLRLEDALVERLGLVESQPHVDQLMVPIHHSLGQRVIGASALSLSLNVSSSRVRKIKENIANHISALRGVFVPLSDPLSAMALEGTTISPISTDDYEFAHTDGQEGTGAGVETVADESVVHFPHVSDTKLDIME
uniref:Transposase (Putative), gypsy type n=1 Tax=Tanacetum cinerariifolium TaxID=118510 RepID=A0A6L2JAL3_TANCI|nr:hypothetical protein [Tanacetum cinerariifolium]